MPSDPAVADRLRRAVEKTGHGFEGRFFFGGVAFFLGGNFAIGVYHERLTLRLGEDAARQAVDGRHVTPMDITGKPMRGWVFVAPEAFDTAAKLRRWVERTHTFVSTLPAKPAKPVKKTNKSAPKKATPTAATKRKK